MMRQVVLGALIGFGVAVLLVATLGGPQEPSPAASPGPRPAQAVPRPPIALDPAARPTLRVQRDPRLKRVDFAHPAVPAPPADAGR